MRRVTLAVAIVLSALISATAAPNAIAMFHTEATSLPLRNDTSSRAQFSADEDASTSAVIVDPVAVGSAPNPSAWMLIGVGLGVIWRRCRPL